jgi:predicted RNase H-like HicB family nuclease
MGRTFTVIVKRGLDGYYIASVPELPGCHTQGRTLDELMENVKEAIALCLEVQSEGAKGRKRTEVMPMERTFTAVIQKRGKWYVAWVEEIPGVNTQGRTLKEVRENLKEALRLVLEVNRELARKRLSPKAKVRHETLRVEIEP